MFENIEELVDYLHSLTSLMPLDSAIDFSIDYLDSLKAFMKFDEGAVLEELFKRDGRMSGVAVKTVSLGPDRANSNGNIYIGRDIAKEIREEGYHIRLSYIERVL